MYLKCGKMYNDDVELWASLRMTSNFFFYIVSDRLEQSVEGNPIFSLEK